jgi:glycosyltransferase involved in cell wall biosynthesis
MHNKIRKAINIFKYLLRKIKLIYDTQIVVCELLIFDDIFPHLLSAFRIAEYNRYLSTFSKSLVYSTATAFPLIKESRDFFAVVKEYDSYYPEFTERVFPFIPSTVFRSKLAYMIFINNAYQFIDIIEKCQLPFVFTLYPGGGFQLNQEESDQKLLRVCSSPYFQKVIVTQKISHEYILKKSFVKPEQVEFIYGGVFPSNLYEQEIIPKKYYGVDKKSFDICFIANKYMNKGIDKGYDTFIEVAKKLLDLQDIHFHVVGSFYQSDIDISLIEDKITFYGTKKTDFFPEFYSKMDIILSPNIPFTLSPGAFDGFPTGCCVEAAFSEVAVFCTDILNQNILFKDREDIVLISTNADEIAETILYFYSRVEELYCISRNGKKIFSEIFSLENQMQPRLKIIENLLK